MRSGTQQAIRIGLIGYGKHGQWAVYPAMRQARGVRLVAVADLSPENLLSIPDPDISTYTDFRRMLRQEQLDAVYVATRVESHTAVAVAALRSGLHVITEKPMADSVRECRRMLAEAEKAGRLLAVDFESRYVPGYRQVRDWIAAGRIGKVGAIHLEHFWDGHKVTGPLADRRRRFCDSSGCLDCGIHKLDLARYFNGGGTWRDIRAYGAWFGEKVRYAPHIAIMARLDTGVLVTVNASFAFTAYIPQRLRSANFDGLAILGDKGVIVLHQAPDGQRHLQIVSRTLEKTVPFVPHGHTSVITLLLTDFARSIRRRESLPEVMATGVDGLMAQMITDEANRLAVEAGDSWSMRPARKRAR